MQNLLVINCGVIQAKKRFGQHFLKDRHISEKICAALINCDIQFENVLEVGPGPGALTQFLYPAFGDRLRLVEIDRDMIPGLAMNYPIIKDKIIEKDFLDLDLSLVAEGSQLAVIGNFPYNISSQILFKIIEYRKSIPVMVGMFQKEVAQRAASNPGSKIYGLLSAWVQAFYEIEYLFTVNEGSFVPPPKVKSAVVRMRRKVSEPDCNTDVLLQVIKSAFNQRRKTLRNSLRSYAGYYDRLPDVSVLDKRAEMLGFEDYIELARLFTP